MDMYRISSVRDVEDLALPSLLRADACIIEWPQVLAPILPVDVLRVTVSLCDPLPPPPAGFSPQTRKRGDEVGGEGDDGEELWPRWVALDARGPVHERLLDAARRFRTPLGPYAR